MGHYVGEKFKGIELPPAIWGREVNATSGRNWRVLRAVIPSIGCHSQTTSCGGGCQQADVILSVTLEAEWHMTHYLPCDISIANPTAYTKVFPLASVGQFL